MARPSLQESSRCAGTVAVPDPPLTSRFARLTRMVHWTRPVDRLFEQFEHAFGGRRCDNVAESGPAALGRGERHRIGLFEVADIAAGRVLDQPFDDELAPLLVDRRQVDVADHGEDVGARGVDDDDLAGAQRAAHAGVELAVAVGRRAGHRRHHHLDVRLLRLRRLGRRGRRRAGRGGRHRRRRHRIDRRFHRHADAGRDLAGRARLESGRLADQGGDARRGLLGDARDQPLACLAVVLGPRPACGWSADPGSWARLRCASRSGSRCRTRRHRACSWCRSPGSARRRAARWRRCRRPAAPWRARRRRAGPSPAACCAARRWRARSCRAAGGDRCVADEFVLEGPWRRRAGRQHDEAQHRAKQAPHSMAHVAITPSRQQNIRMIR